MNIRVDSDPYNCGYALRIFERLGGPECRWGIAEPLVMNAVEEECVEIKPTVVFRRKEEFQDLMDDLWNIGLRPSFKADSYKAEVAAIKFHLEDMRTLVFKEKKK